MSFYKTYGWWKNFDCIFEFRVKSYVRNRINLSCAKIIFPSIIIDVVERACMVWRLRRWKHSSWVWLLDNKNSNYTAKLITTDNFQRQVTLLSTGQKILNLYHREFSVVCFTMLCVRANKLESIWRKCLIVMSSRHSSGQSEEHHRKYHSRLLLSGTKFNEDFSWVKLLSGMVKATQLLRLSCVYVCLFGLFYRAVSTAWQWCRI